jgi:hypothetical protein
MSIKGSKTRNNVKCAGEFVLRKIPRNNLHCHFKKGAYRAAPESRDGHGFDLWVSSAVRAGAAKISRQTTGTERLTTSASDRWGRWDKVTFPDKQRFDLFLKTGRSIAFHSGDNNSMAVG